MESILTSTTNPSSPLKKLKLNSENDRISNLPEPILIHILSFLDTSQAIQSSILSNTYKTLWKTRTSFSFDYNTFCRANPMKNLYPNYFLATVKEVLKKCQPLKLHCFSLCFDQVDRIVSPSVTTLFIFLRHYKHLVVLKLNLGMRQLHSSSLYNCISFPSLETLHFQSVSFTDATDLFGEFFSKCRLLSKLIITDCGIESGENVIISSALLQHLEIYYIHGYAYRYHPNFLTKKKPCEITICTPNLISFKCRSDIANKYLLKNLSALKEAEIDMRASDISQLAREQKKMFGTKMVELLGGLCNAESIMASGLVITVIAQEIEDFTTRFHALRHLKMRTWLTRDTMKVIRWLLHHCDKVETLSLEVISLEVDLGIKRPVFFADWKFSHLRVLKIKGIQGFEEEVDFLKGVLKSATNLEELIVFKPKDPLAGNEMRLDDMRDTLLALPSEALSIKIRIC